jgi:hypothetical protein
VGEENVCGGYTGTLNFRTWVKKVVAPRWREFGDARHFDRAFSASGWAMIALSASSQVFDRKRAATRFNRGNERGLPC